MSWYFTNAVSRIINGSNSGCIQHNYYIITGDEYHDAAISPTTCSRPYNSDVCVTSERRGSVVVSTRAYHAAVWGSIPARTRRFILGVKNMALDIRDVWRRH